MDTIKTGDAIMFSGNSPTSFLLRTFVSSPWNHSGIAIRFVQEDDRFVISLNEKGKLYIFETNSGERFDEIYNENIIGAGFSNADWVFSKYNKIAVRRLDDKFRTDNFKILIDKFVQKYRGKKFPSTSLPFISAWLGIPLGETDDMFCSELMAHFYIDCVGAQYPDILKIPFDNTLSSLFGMNAPYSEKLFTPGHYSKDNTPHANIFTSNDEIVYTQYADIIYVILQPLLIILFIMLIIWMSLPKKNEK